MSKKRCKEVVIDLPVRLSDTQKLDLGEEINELLSQLKDAEDSKKSYAEEKNAEIKDIKENLDGKHEEWVNGTVHEPVNCVFEYHSPQHGEKTLIRTDTNTAIKIYPMSEYDLQKVDEPELFAEYQFDPDIPENLKVHSEEENED